MPNESDDPPLNPYEAPQTTELQPSGDAAAYPQAQDWTVQTIAPLPVAVRRWMIAAIGVYVLSFIVPLAPWAGMRQAWDFGYGSIMFVWGLFYCWHPLFIAWWANVLLMASLWQMKRRRSGPALVYALIAILAAGSYGLISNEGDLLTPFGFGVGQLPFILPYFFWFAAMTLQAVAAWKLEKSMAETQSNGANKTLEDQLS